MKRKTETMVKYNTLVIADSEIEATRAAGCLCLRCIRMVTEADCLPLCKDVHDGQRQHHASVMAKWYNCPIAQRIYEACQDGDVAAPVTRCPMFVEKPE